MTVETRHGPGAPSPGKPRLAFYSFNIVNLFRSDPTGMVGGAEVQYHLLAHHLAADHDIHIVTLAPAPPDDLVVPPGFTLHLVSPAHDDPARNRIGVFWRRSRSFWKAFRAADADIYLERGAGFATFLTWLYARRHRRRFVFHWASDADLKGLFMRESPGVKPLYRHARRRADAQVCQTEAQFAMLRRRERRHASIIPNSLDTRIPWTPRAGGSEVLWVGTIKDETKRADLFLDLAQALPHRRFRMVGQVRSTPAFQAAFHERVARLGNVTVTGFVRRTDLPAQYAHGRVLVNCSDFEGFPNTFLEAAASGVPIVSLNIDPNGMLARSGAGTFLQGDAAGLAPAVDRLFGEGPWRDARAACARVAAQHDPAEAAQRVRALLAGLRGA
ncbi:MAG TPA: glycosyltransferase family 4 protein [Candidatus Thermoplasmatota archaeon]|nr:glycosyltransferase family 4 protein [Candidatus Thermoplasmatota archaeon]